jgi:hypothetical protein
VVLENGARSGGFRESDGEREREREREEYNRREHDAGRADGFDENFHFRIGFAAVHKKAESTDTIANTNRIVSRQMENEDILGLLAHQSQECFKVRSRLFVELVEPFAQSDHTDKNAFDGNSGCNQIAYQLGCDCERASSCRESMSCFETVFFLKTVT